jgi:predicted nucleic acid-binding protein
MRTTPAPYLLDTNIYALFFQKDKTNSYANLLDKIKSESEISFFIPEIVSMEIHSVLGKYRRGSAKVTQHSCTRDVIVDDKSQKCSHRWLSAAAENRINKKQFKNLRKLLDDIESGRDSIRAEILAVGADEITAGKKLLANYADKYTFGSHDALVAGTIVAANQRGLDLTLVTSDKGLKAVCREVGIKLYDPN